MAFRSGAGSQVPTSLMVFCTLIFLRSIPTVIGQSFKDIELVPDENRKVEILELFWELQTYKGIPPVLIYADLMRSGSDRNIETANMILSNELQYIK